MIMLNVWFQDQIIEICLTKHTKLKLSERKRVSKDVVEHITCTYTLRKGVPHMHICKNDTGGERPSKRHFYYSAVKDDWNIQDLVDEGPITLWCGPGRK